MSANPLLQLLPGRRHFAGVGILNIVICRGIWISFPAGPFSVCDEGSAWGSRVLTAWYWPPLLQAAHSPARSCSIRLTGTQCM